MKLKAISLILSSFFVTNFVHAAQKCPLTLTPESQRLEQLIVSMDTRFEESFRSVRTFFPLRDKSVLTLAEGQAYFTHGLLEENPGGQYYALNEEPNDWNVAYNVSYRANYAKTQDYFTFATPFQVGSFQRFYLMAKIGRLTFDEIVATDEFSAGFEAKTSQVAADTLENIMKHLKVGGSLRVLGVQDRSKWVQAFVDIERQNPHRFARDLSETADRDDGEGLNLVIFRPTEFQFVSYFF